MKIRENFQSYFYSYISGRMKTVLTRERRKMNRECQLEDDGNLEDARESVILSPCY
jgi:hypothetical protein